MMCDFQIGIFALPKGISPPCKKTAWKCNIILNYYLSGAGLLLQIIFKQLHNFYGQFMSHAQFLFRLLSNMQLDHESAPCTFFRVFNLM